MTRALVLALTLLFGLSTFSTTLAASPSPSIAGNPSPQAVIDWATPQIDGFYRTLFVLQGLPYHSPKVSIVDPTAVTHTGCGTSTGEGQAFYCSVDEQIVIGTDVLDWTAETDDFTPAYVLAHEWAHHAQKLSGTDSTYAPRPGEWDEVYTIENELRADCMAGAWLGNVDSRGYLNDSDIAGFLMMASLIGDSGSRIGGSHGFGKERLRAVFIGYEEGVLGCMAITPLDRGHNETPAFP